jgi:hypothetical protein
MIMTMVPETKIAPRAQTQRRVKKLQKKTAKSAKFPNPEAVRANQAPQERAAQAQEKIHGRDPDKSQGPRHVESPAGPALTLDASRVDPLLADVQNLTEGLEAVEVQIMTVKTEGETEAHHDAVVLQEEGETIHEAEVVVVAAEIETDQHHSAFLLVI